MNQTINKMTSTERRAVISLSSIMGLRMIGLFMVLPVFSLYATQLQGATPTLIGLAMAIPGMTIGFSFSMAMFIGPVLTQWLSVNNLFFMAAILGFMGIVILYYSVPTAANHHWHRDTEPEFKSFIKLLTSPELAKLN